MSLSDSLRTIFEAALIIFTLWSVFHEDRYISFEKKLAVYIRRRKLKVIKNGSTVRTSCHPHRTSSVSRDNAPIRLMYNTNNQKY